MELRDKYRCALGAAWAAGVVAFVLLVVLVAQSTVPATRVHKMVGDWQVLVVAPNCQEALDATAYGTHLYDALHHINVGDAAFTGAGCKP